VIIVRGVCLWYYARTLRKVFSSACSRLSPSSAGEKVVLHEALVS